MIEGIDRKASDRAYSGEVDVRFPRVAIEMGGVMLMYKNAWIVGLE